MQGVIELKIYLDCDIDEELKEKIINQITKSNGFISHIEEIN